MRCKHSISRRVGADGCEFGDGGLARLCEHHRAHRGHSGWSKAAVIVGVSLEMVITVDTGCFGSGGQVANGPRAYYQGEQ